MCEQKDKQREQLVCPLLRLVSIPPGTPIPIHPMPPPAAFKQDDECLREGCAWWQPVLEQCAVLVAATSEEILKPKMVRGAKAEQERLREILLALGLSETKVQEVFKALVES